MPIIYKIFLFLILQHGVDILTSTRVKSTVTDSQIVTTENIKNDVLILYGEISALPIILNTCLREDPSCEIKVNENGTTVLFKELDTMKRGRIMRQVQNYNERIKFQWTSYYN